MRLFDYQRQAMTYRLPSADKQYALLGLVGEVGELYGYLAKGIRDGYELNETLVRKELGDILWFVAAIAADCGFGLDEIATLNLHKLNNRQNNNTIQGSGDDR